MSLAQSLLGTPYRNGGTDPTGFDCSGLVQYVFGRMGLAVPRSVREQLRLGVEVSRDEIEAGDLLFFAIDGRRVSHVGIAVDLDSFVHARLDCRENAPPCPYAGPVHGLNEVAGHFRSGQHLFVQLHTKSTFEAEQKFHPP